MRSLDPAFNLSTLADRFGSDKGTLGADAHHYTRFYEVLLAPRRGQVSRMLEIGLLRGGPEVGASSDRATGAVPSIQMWLDYFPDAMVHGFDISDFSFFQHPRFTFTRGDSGNADDLRRVISRGERFDLILDDGSHASYHQQLALATLFPALNPGGLYIIEDLHWQSPHYEEVLPKTITTAELIGHWFRTGSFPPSPVPELAGLGSVSESLGYAFLHTQPFIPEQRQKIAVLQKKF
jgi:SAM-dependent methyltransferase